MSEEEIRKIAKEEFMNNVMKQLNSSLIFTYIQNLENQLQQKENIIKEVREFIEWHYDDNKKFYKNIGIGLNYPECDYILKILDKEVN